MGTFEVEVDVRVEPERIWRALTEPDQIAQWFGWDAETLAEEIQFIFFEHAEPDAARFRLEFDGPGEQYLETAVSGGNSVVRAVNRGDGPGGQLGGASAEADAGEAEAGGSDAIEQGWIAFLHQLKRYVESHSSDPRRTLYLTGAGPAGEIAAAVDRRLPGELWFSGTYTRVYGTGDFGPGLAVLYTSAPLGSEDEEGATLTLSTWGLSDSDFFELTSDWLGWWQGLVEGGEAVVHPA
jgi:uncharacterized protein YndB with AHSA1/START domain